MPNTNSPPLSSTVSSVFDQFLKELETEKLLDKSACDALGQCLHDQRFDHVYLRKALFGSEAKK